MPWIHSLQLRTLVFLFIATHIAVTAQKLTDAQIKMAINRLAESARARCVWCNFCATVSLNPTIISLQLGIGNQSGDNLGTKWEILRILHETSPSTK